jgi:hypothetical protein
MPRKLRATMPVTSRQLKSSSATFEKIRCKAARKLPALYGPKAFAWSSVLMKKEVPSGLPDLAIERKTIDRANHASSSGE